MSRIDLPPSAKAALDAHPHPLLFVTVSGAHLYGFDSPDSDWDLRGCHVAPLREVVSMQPAPETFEVMDKAAVPEVDIVTHDIRKYFQLLLKHNGYVLEQVFSPLVAFETPEFEELRAICRTLICRKHRHHFFHFGVDQWKLVGASTQPTVKGLLYTYRPLLAGIHLMRTGMVESNLRRLNETFGIAAISDLIARKIAGHEKMGISPAELASHASQFDRLCLELDAARDASPLPELAPDTGALNDLLIRIRIKGLDQTRQNTP